MTDSAPIKLLRILDSYKITQNYNLRSARLYDIKNPTSQLHSRTFFPHTIKIWNSLPKATVESKSLSIFKSRLHPKIKAVRYELLYYGSRWANIHHSRIRMGCSLLNADLCINLHVKDSAACECGHRSESFAHYLCSCPNFTAQRLKLITALMKLGMGLKNGLPDNELLLKGNITLDISKQKLMFDHLHEFFVETKRFNKTGEY
jgi:hypothetical protein